MLPELLLTSVSSWGARRRRRIQGRAAACARPLGGDENLCGQLDALCGCFTSPGVAIPYDGALRRHRVTLRSPYVSDHCGPGPAAAYYGRRLGHAINMAGRLRSKVVSPPGEPVRWTSAIPTIISHSYSHASLSICTLARTPPGMPAWRTARMRLVNSRLLARHSCCRFIA